MVREADDREEQGDGRQNAASQFLRRETAGLPAETDFTECGNDSWISRAGGGLFGQRRGTPSDSALRSRETEAMRTRRACGERRVWGRSVGRAFCNRCGRCSWPGDL